MTALDTVSYIRKTMQDSNKYLKRKPYFEIVQHVAYQTEP